MTDVGTITAQPWFWWAVGIVVGLPVALLVLTEVHSALVRRGSAAARPVAFLRNYVVPAAALLVLLTQASQISAEVTWVRVVATVFGFLLLLFVLSGLNVVLFSNAREGTWQARLPSIFVDIARLVIVVAGLAVLFSWVWGADVGGLFAALGVTSIVIGLALQNAVGSIISGLLLLFEQPFQLGDWLDTGSVRGRVVEVNWRAVHIETGNGIQIVPNASLAGSSFTNLSEPTVEYVDTIAVSFAKTDPPDRVRALLVRTSVGLPSLVPGIAVPAIVTGPGAYEVSLPLRNLTEAEATRSRYLGWLWYAARRDGLHLDGETTSSADQPSTREALRDLVAVLRLDDEQVEEVADRVTVERFGDGETVQRAGRVPDAMHVLLDGAAVLALPGAVGETQTVARVERGAYLNPTALTREPVGLVGIAVGEVTALRFPVDVVRTLVQQRPALAREIGQEIDRRRQIAELRVGQAVARG